jgi:hypothetical protein
MKCAVAVIVFIFYASMVQAAGFSGTITFREQGGKDTYEVHVNSGKIVSGWAGSQGDPRFQIVGGWYDGRRMVFLYQQVGNDISGRWFAGARHMRKQGNKFYLEYDLSGYKQVLTDHHVPYEIIGIR